MFVKQIDHFYIPQQFAEWTNTYRWIVPTNAQAQSTSQMNCLGFHEQKDFGIFFSIGEVKKGESPKFPNVKDLPLVMYLWLTFIDDVRSLCCIPYLGVQTLIMLFFSASLKWFLFYFVTVDYINLLIQYTCVIIFLDSCNFN